MSWWATWLWIICAISGVKDSHVSEVGRGGLTRKSLSEWWSCRNSHHTIYQHKDPFGSTTGWTAIHPTAASDWVECSLSTTSTRECKIHYTIISWMMLKSHWNLVQTIWTCHECVVFLSSCPQPTCASAKKYISHLEIKRAWKTLLQEHPIASANIQRYGIPAEVPSKEC